MRRWGIEVFTTIGFDCGKEKKEWRRLAPIASAKPYGWDTRAKAEQMLRVCYGPNPNPENTRIVEVEDDFPMGMKNC